MPQTLCVATIYVVSKNKQSFQKMKIAVFLLKYLLTEVTVNQRCCLVDPIINLENFQKQKVYFGYYLAFNFDFKIDYKILVGPDIQVKKNK
jgi:hypothetical protein